MGVVCINSHAATLAEYSKYRSACLMVNAGVATPKTIFLDQKTTAAALEDKLVDLSFPLVIKRDLGGRAVDILLAVNAPELNQWLEKVFEPGYLQLYAAGQVVQPFLKSLRPYDIRIAIVNGEYKYSYTRSLVPKRAGEPPWLASGRWGSELAAYKPNDEQIAVAIAATRSIGAFINEVDMIETESGYSVIENNPTPGFTPNKEAYLIALADALVEAVTG